MVWPVQDNSSNPGRDSRTEERQAGDSQIERGRRDEHGSSLRGNEHSDSDFIQRRPAGNTNSGSKAQGAADSRSGSALITSEFVQSGATPPEALPNEHNMRVRLEALGFGPISSDLNEQILAFQKSRALPQTGICDGLTWKSLLEAGYRLGDRLLYVRTPMMRGEDVAELQNRLGALGFDAGRVDGIFGPDTLRALKDFQRNVGLPVDGICGPTSVEELLRVFGRSSTNIHSVKELEHIRSDIRSLSDLSVAVTHQGFLDAPAELLRAALALKGAHAQVIMHPDPSRLANLSNAQKSDLCIHIEEQPETREIRYYQGFSYTSTSGEALAHLIARYMNAPSNGFDISVVGMNVPVLRETRMTAVTISVEDPSFWVLQSPKTALAVTKAIAEWTNSDFRHET